MATRYFPIIDAGDYGAFRRLPNNDFPETFERWTYLQTSQKDKHLLESSNPKCVDIKVNSKEFAAFCLATNSNYTLHSLDNFAFEQRGREKE